jgi:hypothetical protein
MASGEWRVANALRPLSFHSASVSASVSVSNPIISKRYLENGEKPPFSFMHSRYLIKLKTTMENQEIQC